MLDHVSEKHSFVAATTWAELSLIQLLRGLGLSNRCLRSGSPMTWSIWAETRPLSLGDSIDVRDGQQLLLHLRLRGSFRPGAIPSEPLLRHDKGFPIGHALDVPGDPREQAQFFLNPAASPFQPVQPLLSQQDEFI